MADGPWTDQENDRVVADYFAMLAHELEGGHYNKAERNRDLQGRIERSRASIEFKHRNISAVLKSLGECWIAGYLPAFNTQKSLRHSVQRWFDQHPDWLTRTPKHALGGFREAGQLWIGPAPTLRNQAPPAELDEMLAIAQEFDVAGRDERNSALGRAGEERVLAHERAVLRSVGRSDLAQRLRWVSEEEGDGAGFDIASFAPDGCRRLIEVKTTNGWDRTPFYISRNELAVADAARDEWCLVRLWNFAREPKAFELRPPLDAHVTLTSTTFEASFRRV